MHFINTILPQTLKDALEIKGMRLGLERMKAFDAALKYPSKQFESIHIAGTNGKGSVAEKIASAFPGKKVGLFTSPHLVCYRERIQINQKWIAENHANQILEYILKTLKQKPTYFELLTLLAFQYFANEQVDLAVVEVGLGGRLDATNILNPKLAVITSIDLDHTQYLGESLESIAREKGGVIKPGIPVVVGPNACFYPKNPLLFEVKGVFAHYEEENQAIAKKALEVLGVKNSDLSPIPPCRFERRGNFILDVAHNPAALRRTFERMFHAYPGEKIRVIAAFSADKDIPSCIELIESYQIPYHLITIDHPRAFIPEKPLSFKQAIAFCQKEERVLVCGTFFMMAEARAILEKGFFVD